MENADAQSKHKESWKIINRISGRKTARKGMIKGNTKEERIDKWFSHFKNLFGKSSDTEDTEELEKVLHNLDIEDGLFTREELKKAKRSMKKGKQTGSDNISADVIKECDLDDIVLDFANNLIANGQKPQQWSDIEMIPLPKPGDLTDT